MIEPIIWNKPNTYRNLNPLIKSSYHHPIRITLHSESLSELTGKEADAVSLLRELGNLHEVEILDTRPGMFHHIEIGDTDNKRGIIPVKEILNGKSTECTPIRHPRQWQTIAASLLGQSNLDHPDVVTLFNLILMTQAHHTLKGDILVTSSPALHKYRGENVMKRANPRTPIEAIKIVGLYLRSHDNYTIKATPPPKATHELDELSFYLELVNSKLPNMWKYRMACHAADELLGNNVGKIADSCQMRCVRALQARDAIGIQFYWSKGSYDIENILHHFEDLLINLAGALDSQAAIANCTYGSPSKGSRINFRDGGLKKTIRENGTGELYQLINEKRFIDVCKMLYYLRKTIHAASLEMVVFSKESGRRQFLIWLQTDSDRTILDAAERLGSVDRWGLIKEPMGWFLEPYSYALALVEECFDLIDSIAKTTDIELFFSNEREMPKLKERPAADYPPNQASRVELLGQ